MSDTSLDMLSESLLATHALLREIKTLVEAQAGAIQQLQVEVKDLQNVRSELQAFRDELIGLQFIPRFDYISDGVRRIRLQLEDYEKVQAELTYLPDALNEVFSRIHESIRQLSDSRANPGLGTSPSAVDPTTQPIPSGEV